MVFQRAPRLMMPQTRDFGTTATFASVAFAVRMTWEAVACSMGVAALIGGLGGLWPACIAARAPLARALRAT